MSLKQRMAENGFESNDSYEFAINALQNQHSNTVPCLNIEGDSGRRKTAFANALAHAQDNIPNILYFDFSSIDTKETALPVVINAEDDNSAPAKDIAVKPLDRILSDACAFSEAEKTILILDQLHTAAFNDHIRLYEFLVSAEWSYGGSTFYANKRNLSLYLISEEPMYHSLQKHSFRVWVEKVSNTIIPYKPEDFGLSSDIAPVMEALNALYETLSVAPTFSEYRKILLDIPQCVRTLDDLRHTLYGWMEGIERQQLLEPSIHDLLNRVVMPAVEQYIGVDNIELTSIPADE